MARPRPYIPLSVRVQVAEFQAGIKGGVFWSLYLSSVGPGTMSIHGTWSLGHRLKVLLNDLFPDGGCHLDHDPALILREFNRRTGKYTPDANNPKFLIYRSKSDHQQKTTGRKPGASRTITTKGSDIGIKTKFQRLERKKRRIAKPRGFGAPRTISSRPFPRRKKP